MRGAGGAFYIAWCRFIIRNQSSSFDVLGADKN
jgi:hypothetical protein